MFAGAGAITIGTLDGANVEIREEVGAENFFLFGLTVEQVRELKLRGYRPQEVAEKNASLREVLDFIGSGALAEGAIRTSSVRFSTACCTKIHSWCWPITRLMRTARSRSVPCGATSGHGHAKQSSTWRVWASSHPTVPSLTTATTCGG